MAHKIRAFADKNDMHNFYNAVKKIYGPTNRCITPLKTADGLTILKDQPSILLRWAEHFGTLLNQDSDADPTVLIRPAYTSSNARPRPAPNLTGGPISYPLPQKQQVPLVMITSLPSCWNKGGYLYKNYTSTSPRSGPMATFHNNGGIPLLSPFIRTRVTRLSAATVGVFCSLLSLVRPWRRWCFRSAD